VTAQISARDCKHEPDIDHQVEQLGSGDAEPCTQKARADAQRAGDYRRRR
jgi:hypothetical protein